MDPEQRVRVELSDRASRGWCPGATRPPVRQELETATGWTSFFKIQSVVGRLRRAGAKVDDLASVDAPLPRGGEAEVAETDPARADVHDSEAVQSAVPPKGTVAGHVDEPDPDRG